MSNLSSTTMISLTSSTSSMLANDSIFSIITKLLNGTELYRYQSSDLIEPERYPVRGIHALIWSLCVITYLLAIPVAIRIVRSKSYLNVADYFSLHIVLCAFFAWIPTLLSFLYQWLESFVLRLCRLHYVILSTNQTVPLFFVLYMIIERFLYAYPSLKHKCRRLTHMYCIHLYALFTWLFIMLFFASLSPFHQTNSNSTISEYTKHYCSYSYEKIQIIATGLSIFYFTLFVPALILIGFVLRYFYIMRGTSQIPSIEKLWTIRATSLLCVLVFYEIYSYYLEHITQNYRSLLLVSVLHATFFLIQIIVIIWTEPYWIELLFEFCSCLCGCCLGRRRKTTTPVSVPIETEFHTFPYSSTSGHYSLVDDNGLDEFDETAGGREPTLRVLA